MSDYIVLAGTGPILFREESASIGRIVFVGEEHTVLLEGEKGLSSSHPKTERQRVEGHINTVVEYVYEQIQKIPWNKKKVPVEIISSKNRTKQNGITIKSTKPTVTEIIASTLSMIFRSKESSGKKRNNRNTGKTEGLFSLFDPRHKEVPQIKELLVFEVDRQEPIFKYKYDIFKYEEKERTEGTNEKRALFPIDAQNNIEASKIALKRYQDNFYIGEYTFIMALSRGKACIKEVGNWLYNAEYIEIFSNLQEIIEMFVALFINTVIRSLPAGSILSSIEDYIPADVSEDYSSVIYKSNKRINAMESILQEMELIEANKQSGKVVSQSTMPVLTYFNELSKIIYSPEFIKYIKSVEENISLYKKRQTATMQSAEKKHRTNLSFLFIEVYHRIIKYKMYLEEASKLLKNTSTPQTFENEIEVLERHSDSFSEILQATERFKKIRTLQKNNISIPDCIDDFIEMFELTDGYVIITRTNVVIVNNTSVVALIKKTEIAGCIPVDEDAPSSYIDLAVISIYPPIPDFVVDVMEGVRVHWIRLNFKWEGYLTKFITAFQCSSISTVPGLEMVLRENTVKVSRTQREIPHEWCINKSHKRMLTIRTQRQLMPTEDIYTFGIKNRLTDSYIFKIKHFIDLTITNYSNMMQLPKTSLEYTTIHKAFEVELSKEIHKLVYSHNIISRHFYTPETNEFSKLLTQEYSLATGLSVYIEYLSYILRLLSPQDKEVYSNSAMNGILSVFDRFNPQISNDKFLDLVIGCSKDLVIPSSLSRNEFLLSLLIIRFLSIVAPKIPLEHYLSICSPLFLFNSKDLLFLVHPENTQ
ncbi:hypothetical protein NEOKW01_0472 [Nematocida sp. AWRm80]|nr:hypothetical protein NEOKW01_0472 [Nematocida sp. AWRm80]